MRSCVQNWMKNTSKLALFSLQREREKENRERERERERGETKEASEQQLL